MQNQVRILPVVRVGPKDDVTFLQYVRAQFRYYFIMYRTTILHGTVLSVSALCVGALTYTVMTAGRPSLANRPYNIVSKTPAPSIMEALPSDVPTQAEKESWEDDGGNEAAPIAPAPAPAPKSPSGEAYIAKFGPIARAEMQKYGVPASISLAQGLIESRAGTSKLAVNNNNHFGMKCFSRNCKKGHCTNFTDDTHKDFFLKFSNAQQSWRAHSQLLASGRYAKLKRYGRDYRRWAQGLKAVGYATDRTYAQKLIGVIERYNLYRYDR
jgi:flagellum-specific peptidoglycan hydrolase FlgJ